VGGWHYPESDWVKCTPDNASIAWPVEPKGPGLPPTKDGCGPPPLNAGCGIRLAHAKSPFGPWTIDDVAFSDTATTGGATPDKALTCARSDPSPTVLPDGSVALAFGSGGCVGGLETVGVARAASWNKTTFHFTSAHAIADVSTFHCPTGQLAEDANLWHGGAGRGWHVIAHNLCSWHFPGRDNFTDNYAMHAWSEDGETWTVSTNPTTGLPSLPWSKNVLWRNGSTTYMSRMERPQVILDAETGTHPIYLTTAVCPGGDTVGGAACHYTIPSWNLYRPISTKKKTM